MNRLEITYIIHYSTEDVKTKNLYCSDFTFFTPLTLKKRMCFWLVEHPTVYRFFKKTYVIRTGGYIVRIFILVYSLLYLALK